MPRRYRVPQRDAAHGRTVSPALSCYRHPHRRLTVRNLSVLLKEVPPRMRRLLSLLVLLCLFALPAFSNTITVTGFTDALSNADGVCTIREAVLNANFNNGAW